MQLLNLFNESNQRVTPTLWNSNVSENTRNSGLPNGYNRPQSTDVDESQIIAPITSKLDNPELNHAMYLKYKNAELIDTLSPEIKVYEGDSGNRGFYMAVHSLGQPNDEQIIYLMEYTRATGGGIGSHVVQKWLWAGKEHRSKLGNLPTKLFYSLLDDYFTIATDSEQTEEIHSLNKEHGIWTQEESSLDKLFVISKKQLIKKVAESINESNTPSYVYRIVDKNELMDALKVGYLTPSKFYGRIHASYKPEPQYSKTGDRVLQIQFDHSDGWKEKQGDKVYLTTDSTISLDKVKVIDSIGTDEPLFNIREEEYTGIDTITGELSLTKGYIGNVFPKVYNAAYFQMQDDNGVVVYSFKWNDTLWLCYRSDSGYKYTTDLQSVLDDLKKGISFSPVGKFYRKVNESIDLLEKAVSKKQQRFFGMVHSAQSGNKPVSKEIAKVAKSMSKQDVTDFAKTKHKNLPEDNEMDYLRKLAGIGKATNYPPSFADKMKKKQYESANNIKPGTPEWFRLHFAQRDLTGELPYDGTTK